MFTLKLRKVLMYEFQYDYVKIKYGNNSKLLFTEADSFMCGIKTKYVHEDFSSDKEKFGFSHYSSKLKYHDDSNK